MNPFRYEYLYYLNNHISIFEIIKRRLNRSEFMRKEKKKKSKLKCQNGVTVLAIVLGHPTLFFCLQAENKANIDSNFNCRVKNIPQQLGETFISLRHSVNGDFCGHSRFVLWGWGGGVALNCII